MKFFERMLTVFLLRQKPDSTSAKPRFMKNTSAAVINTQTVSAAIFRSPGVCARAGAAPSRENRTPAADYSWQLRFHRPSCHSGNCTITGRRGLAVSRCRRLVQNERRTARDDKRLIICVISGANTANDRWEPGIRRVR